MSSFIHMNIGIKSKEITTTSTSRVERIEKNGLCLWLWWDVKKKYTYTDPTISSFLI